MGILRRRHIAFASLICVSFLLTPIGARGGEAVEEYRLKGAFLYNFAKFVSWPGNLTEELASLQVCVNGPASAHDAIKTSLAGKAAAGLPIEVRALGEEASAVDCQVIFTTRDGTASTPRIARFVSDQPVLLVGESHEFARNGGMIGFVEENAKLRFEVNLEAVEQAGLRISSHLLKLARMVDN
ncbi:MAG: YfiR family protein [bacterium]|nr:YfiR family protein [bacterium]MCP5068840.1 YfiR family protein [bacterium]